MQDYTITPEEAQARAADWKNDQDAILAAISPETGLASLPILSINAFTFELNDLFSLCIRIYNYNNPSAPITVEPGAEITNPVNAIRFYLGNKTEAFPGGITACLMGLAVKDFDGANHDGGKDVYDLPEFKAPVTSSIYDFSYPCPTTCAQKNYMLTGNNKTKKNLKDL